MKRVSLITLSLALLMIAGCSDVGYKKTKSGLMYKVMSEGKPDSVKRGDWLKLHVRQTLNDSVLAETYTTMPVYIQSDSFPAMYDPREVIPYLRKGDTAVVVMMADSIFKRQGGLPPFMKRKDKLILTFKVLDVFKNDSLKLADETVEANKAQTKQSAETESQRASVEKEIEDFLKQKNTNYQKAAGGTYVVVTDPGTDPKADTGFVASVKYKGTFFKSEEVFDQNMDGTKPPYPVPVGMARVVKGWEEGLPYFGKGGKGTLYVPFWQGYGVNGPGGKKYVTMVFDIEITDVKPAEAQPAPPGPQPPTQ